ncbi:MULTISPECIES: hypothetical protein [Streptomyces]
MKMSSDFAQTVAAVAPVILLVGVVEMRTFGLVLRQRQEEVLSALEPLHEELRSDVSEDRRSEIRQEMRGVNLLGVRRNVVPMILSALWMICSVLLAIATYRALAYIASGSPGGHAEMAEEMLSIILLGLVVLVIIPLAMWLRHYLTIPIALFGGLLRERRGVANVGPSRFGVADPGESA